MRAPPSQTMPPVTARISVGEPKSGCSNSRPTSTPAAISGFSSAFQLSPMTFW
jgi:hypothetical protein